MNGFGNALSFKDIDDADIEAVEHVVKTQTLNILSKKMSESNDCDCDVLIDNDQLEEYFGEVYKEAPDQFKFLAGDIKTIKRAVEHVKRVVDGNGVNTGLKLFKPKPNVLKRTNKIKSIVHSAQETAASNNSEEKDFDDLLPQLKSTLFTKVMEWLKQYKVDQQMDLAVVNPDIVSVVVENGQIYGYIDCVICSNQENGNKEKPKKISYCFDKSGSQYWISSNFTTHLKSKHQLQKNGEKKNAVKKCKHDVEHDISNVNVVESNLVSDQNASIQIISTENISLPQVKICNFYDQISKQITVMTQAVIENSEHESACPINLSATQSTTIKIVQADPDGNCLFTSLAHQLYHSKMQSAEIKKKAKQLRAAVVEQIQHNVDLYRFDLKGRVYNIIDEKKLNGEYSDSDSIDLEKEITFFLYQLLPKNRFWGGSETLKAVSDLCKVNILVFAEEETFVAVTREGSSYERTIAVAHRCGIDGKRNHYDSVTDIAPDDIYALAGLK